MGEDETLVLTICSNSKLGGGVALYNREHPIAAHLPPKIADELIARRGQALDLLQRSVAVSDGQELRHLECNVALRRGPDFGGTALPLYRPAVARYDGRFYKELGSPMARVRLVRESKHRIVILSGLYGLLAPCEGIQEYACPIGADGLVRAVWTREQFLTRLLLSYLGGAGSVGLVLDLSGDPEYRSLIDWPQLSATGVRVLHAYGRRRQGANTLASLGAMMRETLLPPATDTPMLWEDGKRLKAKDDVIMLLRSVVPKAVYSSTPDSSTPATEMHGGQYRIVRPLGKGGMGCVYLAQNTKAFGRDCVVKEMLPYYVAGEETKANARFEEEARTLSELKHPGIPDMYGYFSEDGHHYIVMEYISGMNLDDLARGCLPDGDSGLAERDIIGYILDICSVLEYLAAVVPQPVVHCDIKPSNIVVERQTRQACLVDFGTSGHSGDVHLPYTPDGKPPSVYGTLGFASPELIEGRPVPKSDVFALANTLYAVLTGDDPSDHPYQWLRLEALTDSLASILEDAMALDASKRLDATQFGKRLSTYVSGRHGASARPTSSQDPHV